MSTLGKEPCTKGFVHHPLHPSKAVSDRGPMAVSYRFLWVMVGEGCLRLGEWKENPTKVVREEAAPAFLGSWFDWGRECLPDFFGSDHSCFYRIIRDVDSSYHLPEVTAPCLLSGSWGLLKCGIKDYCGLKREKSY